MFAFVQIRFQCEGLLTTRTLEILCGGMCLHVRPQIRSVSKRFPTNIAVVRLVTSVGPQVALQQPGPGESFPTELTLVVEVVGEDVHLEGRGAHVHLVADVARLGRLRGQLLVGLLVPGEVGAGGEVLAALLAPELGLGLRTLVLGPPVRLVERVYRESLDEVFRYRLGQGRSF